MFSRAGFPSCDRVAVVRDPVRPALGLLASNKPPAPTQNVLEGVSFGSEVEGRPVARPRDGLVVDDVGVGPLVDLAAGRIEEALARDVRVLALAGP